MEKLVILKIGGSLLSPSATKIFDFDFAYDLKSHLLSLINQGYSFVIAVGGGVAARNYQTLVSQHGESDEEDIHRVGMAITNVNIEILKNLFPKDIVFPKAQTGTQLHSFLQRGVLNIQPYRLLFLNSETPGRSNDWNAVEAADILGLKQVISVKGVKGVYTADPKLDHEAKLLGSIDWKQYFDIVGGRGSHKPGASYPVDLVTAEYAEELGVSFVLIGADLDNFDKVVTLAEGYEGTVVGLGNRV